MSNETEKQILEAAAEKTSLAYQSAPTVANLREWDAAKRGLEKFLRDQESAANGPRFKNLSEVSRWLVREGYKIQERTVRNHAKQNLFPVHPGGEYLQRDIEAYAQRERLERPGYETRDGAPTSKDRLTTAMAQERELRVKKLEGALLDAAEEEARDARLWRAVRYEVEQQAPAVINEIIERVTALGIPEELRLRVVALIPDLRLAYEENISDIFNRFAVDGGVWVEE